MRVILLDPPRDFLAIGDLRSTDVDFDLMGALQNVDFGVEMKFIQAFDDRLTGFQVSCDAKCGSSAASVINASCSLSRSPLFLDSIACSINAGALLIYVPVDGDRLWIHEGYAKIRTFLFSVQNYSGSHPSSSISGGMSGSSAGGIG